MCADVHFNIYNIEFSEGSFMNEKIYKRFRPENDYTLYHGDCFDLIKKIPENSIDLIVTSPPYCMGKSYERPEDDLETFTKQHEKLFPEVYRITKPGGSICWQIGYHVENAVVMPLDYVVFDIINNRLPQEISQNLILRNRIVWTFGHGLNCSTRFSGRHEMLLWFTKGDEYYFDLDAVRVPQKYPGKRYYKGDKKGKLSGNPLGKNPSDVWDVPNVKANHIEKTEHPCQFPVSIPQRLIKALTPVSGIVYDPFVGSGTSGVAAALEKRRFVGSELSDNYYEIAEDRIRQAINGTVAYREDKPAMKPDLTTSVAKLPEEFFIARQTKVLTA
jgi:adenine-specific DNA-methyltransferase